MDHAALTFDPVPWGPSCEAWLSRIKGHDRYAAAIRDRVTAGQYQALSIRHDGAPVGLVVLSIETDDAGPVLIVNAAAAAPVLGMDWTAVLFSSLRQLAAQIGAVAIRFVTDRPGLVRKARALGARRRFVLEVPTHGVQ